MALVAISGWLCRFPPVCMVVCICECWCQNGDDTNTHEMGWRNEKTNEMMDDMMDERKDEMDYFLGMNPRNN